MNSCLALSIVVGMSVSDFSQTAIGNLGWNDIHLTRPGAIATGPDMTRMTEAEWRERTLSVEAAALISQREAQVAGSAQGWRRLAAQAGGD